jgi:branched-chain amino acid transport system permease protein/neutral amino acid transport system permease protein
LLVVAGWGLAGHPEAMLTGVIVGSILALGALGLTLAYSILKLAHFAHGDAMMLGAYLAFFFLSGRLMGTTAQDVQPFGGLAAMPGLDESVWRFSFGPALLLAILVSAPVLVAVLLLVDRFVYGPLRQRDAGLALLAVASLGVAIAMRGAVLLLWGPTPRSYYPGIRPTLDLPGGVRLVADHLFIVAVAGLLAGLLYLVLYRTEIGRAMRATADNPDLARVVGIDTARVVRWTWALTGALVSVAGSLLALQSQLKPELGFLLLLPIFAATILGGIGSPQGALAGGLIVGIVQEVTVAVGIVSPGYKFAVAFVILIAVILVRPRGLFGA